MKVIAKKNRELALINAQNTQNENRAETIELIVPEEYENYNKKIVFVTDDGTVWDIITNNEYKITNAITKYKQVDFYIWLTKEVDGESIDFRTKTKTLNFYHNEDASDEITDEEIHGVNTVVNLLEEEIEKVENLNIEATKIGDTTTVTITKKDGTTESVNITDGQNGQDGKDGKDGQDAKINGKNSIEIEAGNNITIDDTENGIIINSTGGGSGGTSNYNDLSNKPKINNVELNGNKSLNDLGIQPKGNYLISETDPTVPSYVKNITQANITSWNNKSDFSGNYNDLSNKPTIPDELKDLSDDSTHRLVTDTEKSTWNNKSDFSGNYNDLTNKPSEVTETTVSNWGFTKNTGTYSKPNGGIPKTDLSSAVQTSLGKADTAIQSHQDISGKEDKTNKSDSYTISSSETYASTKALVDGLATKKNIETKTITENDIRWHNGWKDCYNGTQLNLDVSGTGRMSMTPLWIIKGTTLNVNTSFYTQANTASGTKAYVDIELYKPSDGSANAYGWVNKVRKYMDIQGNYTIDETGYYIISVFNCTASNNPLKDYGKPYTFSYTVEGDFEVNYVNTVDWKIKDIVFVLNDNTQPSFSNGLNWACRREIGQPYYLANSGSASEHDMGCYSYNTNDFSGTRSSVSRQAVFVYNDEIWYFSPSLDGHVGIASLSKFKIYDNNWIEYIGHCWHNLGHMNAVGYEKSTDVFIWGNGSSSYSQEGEGYIINNFSNSKLATSYNDEIVLMSDMDVDVGSFAKATYGFKVNVIPFSVSCNNNSAPYNLYVAMVTNDGNTFRIGKITANSSGKYLWTNCVWENAKNIGDVSETQTESYEHCVQGMAVLNGHIIMGEGHTKPQIATIWNDTSTTLRTSCLLQQFLDSSITAVAVFDNKLVYCSSYEWIFTDITSLNNGISENKINELIENAIGNAIGGSY